VLSRDLQIYTGPHTYTICRPRDLRCPSVAQATESRALHKLVGVTGPAWEPAARHEWAFLQHWSATWISSATVAEEPLRVMPAVGQRISIH
jgi:hypothetical protein